MKTTILIRRNLTWFRRTNLAVVLGVATAVAVLTGALMVGDSVRRSLRDLVIGRLGRTDLVVTASNLFREQLIDDLKSSPQFAATFADGVSLLALPGVTSRDETGARAGDVQVYGVDQRFWDFHGLKVAEPGRSEGLISPGLAAELGVSPGEMLAVRIETPAAIPVESLHGRRDETGQTIRFTVREVLPSRSLGEFSLQPRQGEVRAIFLPLARLQRYIDQAGPTGPNELNGQGQGGRVNVMLLAARPGSAAATEVAAALLRDQVTLDDLAIRLRPIDREAAPGVLSVETTSAIISDSLAQSIEQTATGLGVGSDRFLSYLANTIRIGEREVPYSLITAVEPEYFRELVAAPADPLPPIILNEWTARDLGARVGQSVTLEYYVWEDEGRLATKSATFRLAGIVPISGLAADRQLAPEYPGITGAESLSDWDPPFPLDLGRVRKVDEEYWDRYRATPKAFVRLSDAQPLWATRYGALTSVRLAAGALNRPTVAAALRREVGPVQSGFTTIAVRAQGTAAARGATDFGAYFSYFSFFLVVAALLLVVLFFRLGVEQRIREIGLYRALGFTIPAIRKIFLTEGAVLALLGAGLGLAGAVIYAGLMLLGLRTWWVGAVGTRLLRLHVDPLSLIIGAVAGVSAALLCVWWTIRSTCTGSPRGQLAGQLAPGAPRQDNGARLPAQSKRLWIALSLALTAVILLLLAARQLLPPSAGFFGAGSLLLIALLTLWSWWLRTDRQRLIRAPGWPGLLALGLRQATTRPGRSILSMALIAAATFIIVSVESFRRGEAAPTSNPKSGTGGFLLVAESLLPIADNLNLPEGRAELNLTDPELDNLRVTRLRVRQGDDTSCLNLYQPRQPRILGLPPDFIAANRFNFQAMLESRANPWELLNQTSGPIPIIVDANSMNYVLHRQLGEVFQITAGNGEPVEVRIVATLADSLLQSELLMAESHFVRLFPREDGYRWFGIERSPTGSADPEAMAALLEDRLSDFGFDATSAARKLSAYHVVENTYLSTFQSIGGLGLLLGTIGLGAVLLRNVLERRKELALFTAIGFRARHLTTMILAENALLLGGGLLTGALAAIIAIIPALVARGGIGSLPALGLLLLLVIATGLLASLLAVRAALRSPVLEALRSES
jgi:ABC-type antimicrobial peptide transport system permease subunit